MHEGLLEIREHNGEGYQALVDYGEWRVAILRFENGLLPDNQTFMERHLESDEIFVLMGGEGTLIVGGNGPGVGALFPQALEMEKIYNVRKNAWHTISLSRDAAVLIVENRDTSRENSEYAELSPEQRRTIVELTKG